MRRRLSPDEQALWSALARTVRPIRPQPRIAASLPPAAVPVMPPAKPPKAGKSGLTRNTPPPPASPPAPPVRTPAAVLDTGWERRIRNGAIMPDISIDLHGHSLSAAHVRLNQAIGSALAQDLRVLLIVTGKPPKGAGGVSRRGAIRGEIGHWLETSAYADRIASVRVAHPRHGGDGAIYLILRRRK